MDDIDTIYIYKFEKEKFPGKRGKYMYGLFSDDKMES